MLEILMKKTFATFYYICSCWIVPPSNKCRICKNIRKDFDLTRDTRRRQHTEK